MKASRANELRGIIALAFLLGGMPARAQSPAAAGTALPQVTTTAPQHSTAIGVNVAGVRIVTQDGKILLDAPTDLPVQAGKPLDPNQVAESIRKLYRTGNYADEKVTVTPVETGVRVDFVVREQ